MTLQNFTLGTFAQGAAGGGGAFESIATATGTGSSTTLTFNSIPGTFQHLQIRGIANTPDAISSTQATMRFNSDSGSNYNSHLLYGDGATVSASGLGSRTNMFAVAMLVGSTYNTNIHGVTIIDILDYASTTKNKTVRIFTGDDVNAAVNGVSYVYLNSGLWRNTNAITSISIDFTQNASTTSRFALYGIKGA